MDISVHSPCRDVPGGHTLLKSQQSNAEDELTLPSFLWFLKHQFNLIQQGILKKKKKPTDLCKQRIAKIFLILAWKCILKKKPSSACFVQVVRLSTAGDECGCTWVFSNSFKHSGASQQDYTSKRKNTLSVSTQYMLLVQITSSIFMNKSLIKSCKTPL